MSCLPDNPGVDEALDDNKAIQQDEAQEKQHAHAISHHNVPGNHGGAAKDAHTHLVCHEDNSPIHEEPAYDMCLSQRSTAQHTVQHSTAAEVQQREDIAAAPDLQTMRTQGNSEHKGKGAEGGNEGKGNRRAGKRKSMRGTGNRRERRGQATEKKESKGQPKTTGNRWGRQQKQTKGTGDRRGRKQKATEGKRDPTGQGQKATRGQQSTCWADQPGPPPSR